MRRIDPTRGTYRGARLLAAVALLVACSLASAGGALAAGRCGKHPWCNTALGPDARAALLLKALTSDERIGLLGGDDVNGVLGREHTHTGTEDGVPRVGLPPTYYSDGPAGPRAGKATALPAPLALAATFSTRLASQHGAVASNEARSKGNDVIYGPTTNVMRTPLNGRTFESYGEDPYLTTRLGVAWIKASQAQGLLGDVKHFAANNQEGRDPSGHGGDPGSPLGGGTEGSRYVVNEHIDERTLREIYLPHFEAAVKEAHVASVMCAYNKVNGAYACENHHLLQQILEREWGFKGYVLADYGAAHVAGPSLVNGLDFEPWPGVAYGPTQVRAALLTGQATMAQVNAHVRRVLRTLFAYGFFDRRAYRDDAGQIDKRTHARTAERIEEAAITLLRNRPVGRARTAVLPLRVKRLKTVAVIGAGAESYAAGGGSSRVEPFRFVSPRAAIRKRLPKRVKLRYEDGSDPDRAAAAARGADVAIVIPADYLTEGVDRLCLRLECPDAHGDQDELIRRVAAANRRTVVVLETGGPVLTPWRRKVAALLEAWYPGQEAGTAIARVLFGDANPGGRLPATFPRSESQLPTAGDPERYPGVNNEVYYKEGVLVGYRWYDARRLAPAFPFGFGLSYTRFAYGGLRVGATRGGARVRVHVANVGRRRGADVVQLYLHLPQPSRKVVQPPKQLRGFRRVSVRPHRRRTLTFKLGRRAFAYWDTPGHRWRVAPGCYGVLVGRSSRNIVQRTTIAVGGAACRGASAHVLPHG